MGRGKHTKLSQLHLDRWAAMMEYQETIKPYPLVMGEILDLWQFTHRRGPVNTLKKLEEHGYVKVRKSKRFFLYYAVDPFEQPAPTARFSGKCTN